MRATAPFTVWNVLPEALVDRWSSRAMTQWKKLDGGVTNLVAVCLPQVRDFGERERGQRALLRSGISGVPRAAGSWLATEDAVDPSEEA